MSKEVLLEAYSPAEARLRASALLNEAPDRAETTVIQKGRRGVLGLGKRPALIRVMFPDPATLLDRQFVPAGADPRMPAKVADQTDPSFVPPAPNRPLDDVQILREQGIFHPAQVLVEIRNERLLVHPGDGSGYRPAVIKADDGITLIVDGEEIQGEAVITGQESLEFRYRQAPPENTVHTKDCQSLNIAVSPDGMTAAIQFHVKYRYRLCDAPPADNLLLCWEPEKVLPCDVSLPTIHKAVEEAGVVFGLDETALEEAVSRLLQSRDEDISILIAQGVKPEPGADGHLELIAALEQRSIDWSATDEAVDFRERDEIPSVQSETVLGLIHAPRSGRPGRTVHGKPVPAPEAQPAHLKVGNGVRKEIQDDYTVRLIAKRQGRPIVQESADGHWLVNVLPVHIHDGNVDMESGHLKFDGDVTVRGNVTEGMRVVAAGDILVHGGVSGGVLVAGGNVEVRGNVFKGRIVAGYLTLLYDELAPLLQTLQSLLDDLDAAADQLKGAAYNYRGLRDRIAQRLLPHLIAMKFPQLPELAKTLRVRSAVDELDHRIHEELEPLIDALAPLSETAKINQFSVMKAAGRIREAGEKASIHRGLRAGAIVGYSHNTQIRVSGNIIVMRKGSYYSALTAQDKIRIFGPAVGGRLEAKNSVKVPETGSRNMAFTLLSVRHQGVIQIGLAHPSTRLQIGGISRTLDRQHRSVRAVLDGKRLNLR